MRKAATTVARWASGPVEMKAFLKVVLKVAQMVLMMAGSMVVM